MNKDGMYFVFAEVMISLIKMNLFHYFQVVVPWCSPLSIRALFSLRPFLADYAVSQSDVSI